MSFGCKFHALVVFSASGREQLPHFGVFLPYLMQLSRSLAELADTEVKVTAATLSHCSCTPCVKIVTLLPDSSSPCGETFRLLIACSRTQIMHIFSLTKQHQHFRSTGKIK